MICHLCGSKNRNNAKFCKKCGNSFIKPAPQEAVYEEQEEAASPEDVVFCMACGSENPASLQFCEVCGAMINVHIDEAVLEPQPEESEESEKKIADKIEEQPASPPQELQKSKESKDPQELDKPLKTKEEVPSASSKPSAPQQIEDKKEAIERMENNDHLQDKVVSGIIQDSSPITPPQKESIHSKELTPAEPAAEKIPEPLQPDQKHAEDIALKESDNLKKTISVSSQPEDTKQCPTCKNFNRDNASFCRFCGYSFKKKPTAEKPQEAANEELLKTPSGRILNKGVYETQVQPPASSSTKKKIKEEQEQREKAVIELDQLLSQSNEIPKEKDSKKVSDESAPKANIIPSTQAKPPAPKPETIPTKEEEQKAKIKAGASISKNSDIDTAKESSEEEPTVIESKPVKHRKEAVSSSAASEIQPSHSSQRDELKKVESNEFELKDVDLKHDRLKDEITIKQDLISSSKISDTSQPLKPPEVKICIDCNYENNPLDSSCRMCGITLDEDTLSEPSHIHLAQIPKIVSSAPKSEPVKEKLKTPEMPEIKEAPLKKEEHVPEDKFCSSCGFKNRHNAAFCKICGSTFAEKQAIEEEKPVYLPEKEKTEKTEPPPKLTVKEEAEENTIQPDPFSSKLDYLQDNILSVQNGRYEILKILGSGGTGRIFLAKDTRMGINIVLKELHPIASDEETVEYLKKRFVEEAKLLFRLVHKGFPRVVDYFSEQGRLFIIMQYIEGSNLSALLGLQPQGRFPLDQCLKWLNDMLELLIILQRHDPPIIHRDIKPANIMIDKNNDLYLVDFGFARTMDKGSNTRVGTYGYASPEHFSGKFVVSSDIFSLGATFHHLITGENPQKRKDPFSYPPINKYVADFPPELQKIFDKMLSLSKAYRYQNAQELKKDLDSFLKQK